MLTAPVLAPTSSLVPAASGPDAIREKAEEFEGIFIAQMMQTMFQGLETDGIFGGGHSEEMFRDLMVQEYGNVIAKRGGIGVADAVARQMLAYQEAAI